MRTVFVNFQKKTVISNDANSVMRQNLWFGISPISNLLESSRGAGGIRDIRQKETPLVRLVRVAHVARAENFKKPLS